MNLLEKSIDFALKIHEDQVDRYGRPYILHPLTVMLQMDTDEEMMAAVLHDVVEDSDTTLEELRRLGLPDEVVRAVSLLTHNKDRDAYDEYVRQLKPNPIARKVKLADLAHNMDVRRMDEITEKDAVRLDRYRRAWETLSG